MLGPFLGQKKAENFDPLGQPGFSTRTWNSLVSGRWHKKSDWKGEREVTREEIVGLLRKIDVKTTWRRDGSTLRVTWPGGGWEELTIDPKNPNRLSGGNGKQGVQWDRVVAPQKKKIAATD